MEETKDNIKKGGLRTASDVLSGVFLPLLVPTYTYVIALWTSPLSMIPERIRLLSSIIVFLITAIPPLGIIIFMMRKGKVADVSISNPKERTIPYIVTIICYLLAAFYLRRLPHWMPMFFVGAAIAGAIATLITFKWKISAHATSMGGMCALLIYIGLNHIATVIIIPWIAAAILCSGAVGSARLYLGRHTQAQVYAGWLLGLAVAYTMMAI